MEQKKKSAFTPLGTKKRLRKRRFLTGFTLLELLFVIALIGIIASIAVIRYGPVLESGRRAEAYAVLSEIVTAEKRYYLDSDPSIYTATITNLDSFTTDPNLIPGRNFDYSVPSTDVSSGYAQAARTSGTGGRRSYGMCLESGKRAECDAAVCNPGCPN